MAIIEIVYEAKCKHCKHFNSERKVKKMVLYHLGGGITAAYLMKVGEGMI